MEGLTYNYLHCSDSEKTIWIPEGPRRKWNVKLGGKINMVTNGWKQVITMQCE